VQFITRQHLPPDRPVLICSEARWYWIGHAVTWLVVLFLFVFDFVPSVLTARRADYAVLVVAALITIAAGYGLMYVLRRTVAAFGPDNWIFMLTRRGFAIRIRSFARDDLPEEGPTIALIDFSEIAAVGEYFENWSIVRRAGRHQNDGAEHFINLYLTHTNTDELRRWLVREQLQSGGGMSVFVPGPGMVRFRFQSKFSRIEPNPDVVMHILSERFRVEPTVEKRWKHRQWLSGPELMDYVDARCDRGERELAAEALAGQTKCGVVEARQQILQRRRTLAGLCATCGYDMRATPDRCPECGSVPIPEKLLA
jgi:hypothetical protein